MVVALANDAGGHGAAVGIPEGKLLVALVVGVLFHRLEVMQADEGEETHTRRFRPVLTKMSNQYRNLQQIVRFGSRQEVDRQETYAGKTFQASNIQQETPRIR